METIVLGGGCFWCIEAILQRIDAVVDVIPGYAGGIVDNPSYEDVTTGNTGHAEVVKVNFDPNVITLEKILKVFFLAHDPTSLNRQGNDVGTQYRSIILYTNKKQREVIESVVDGMQSEYDDPIVTEVEELKNFYEAEEYHKDYYNKNPNTGYCRLIIKSKLEKVLKEP